MKLKKSFPKILKLLKLAHVVEYDQETNLLLVTQENSYINIYSYVIY